MDFYKQYPTQAAPRLWTEDCGRKVEVCKSEMAGINKMTDLGNKDSAIGR